MSDLVETKAEAWKDYEAIERAVLESERGRWFLDEYGKRLRGSETAKLLAAMRKLEQAVAHSQDFVTERLGRALGIIETVDRRLAGAPEGSLAQRQMKFFTQDEEIFEAEAGATAAPVKVQLSVLTTPEPSPSEGSETVSESDQEAAPDVPQPVAEAAEIEAKPKRRIVIIRHEPGDEIPVPLEHEAVAEA
ncbi:MAG: hypothetical protein FJX63_03045 [Alphaproteobacteria bacterium]|nr:hypothetical protein [Alphaproteobacteria bacterium]